LLLPALRLDIGSAHGIVAITKPLSVLAWTITMAIPATATVALAYNLDLVYPLIPSFLGPRG
jgi:hypothetical protein